MPHPILHARPTLGVPPLLARARVPFMSEDQAAATIMARDVKQRLPSGRYVCLYDGDGYVQFMFDASAPPLSAGSRVRARQGRIEVDVRLSLVPDNGILLRIIRTNPADPVHNIRVIMPGACSRACVHVCVRACVCACVRACMPDRRVRPSWDAHEVGGGRRRAIGRTERRATFHHCQASRPARRTFRSTRRFWTRCGGTRPFA